MVRSGHVLTYEDLTVPTGLNPLKPPSPLALLSFSPSCCSGTRHVAKNTRHVRDFVVMLMEMPVMLVFWSSC